MKINVCKMFWRYRLVGFFFMYIYSTFLPGVGLLVCGVLVDTKLQYA